MWSRLGIADYYFVNNEWHHPFSSAPPFRRSTDRQPVDGVEEKGEGGDSGEGGADPPAGGGKRLRSPAARYETVRIRGLSSGRMAAACSRAEERRPNPRSKGLGVGLYHQFGKGKSQRGTFPFLLVREEVGRNEGKRTNETTTN